VKARILVAALVGVSAVAFADLAKVAVLDAILPAGMDPEVSIGVTEKISEEMVNSGKYTVLDRTTVGQSLKEIEFQMSGLVSEEAIRKAGNQLSSRLGASYVVVAQVSRMGATYFISAKLIDISTGQIIAQASDQGGGDIDVNLTLATNVGSKLASGTMEPARTATSGSSPSAAPVPAPATQAAPSSFSSWGKLAGAWKVDTAKRPKGWNDFRYVFKEDGRLQIYHLVNGVVTLVFQGMYLSMDSKKVTTRIEYDMAEAGRTEMTMDYSLSSSSLLKIGWDGVMYLQLNRE
jgi:TolB-like protein